MYQKHCCEEKHVELLLIGEGEKNMFLQTNVGSFLISRKKHFCRYCLHAFITEEILKRLIKDYFKINGEQTTKIPEKDKYIKFKF